MVKSHVSVYIRKRPCATQIDGLQTQPDGRTLTLTSARHSDANTQEGLAFKFDGVLENQSQEAVYTTCAQDVVANVLAGYNGTVFCYGQTGAGKTYTMCGDLARFNLRGIAPRAMHQVFQEVDMRPDRVYTITVSYLEIYNEALYDLLAPNPSLSGEDLHIAEEGGQTVVRGLSSVEVKSEEEALAQFFKGEGVRSVALHSLNAASSRSHCIFSLQLAMRAAGEASERAVAARLHLVDLAGSERTKKTNATGTALKEANSINKSLTFLEQTVSALAKEESHVPYRQTKLTAVLRDALGGNCKTVMVANIWPEPAHLEETVSTLRFAARVRMIQLDSYVAESSDPSLLARRYERQIRELKSELAMRDTLSGRGQTSYDDLSEVEVSTLGGLCRQFLHGELAFDELPLDTMKRIREAFRQMQQMFQAQRAELRQELGKEAQARPAEDSPSRAAQPTAAGPTASPLQAEGVGEPDREGSSGFHLGQAPADARPPPQPALRPRSEHPDSPRSIIPPSPGRSFDHQAADADGSPASPSGRQMLHSTGGLGPGESVDMNVAFIQYKRDNPEGQELAEAVRIREAELRAKKAAIREVSLAVNETKRGIDSKTEQLEEIQARVVPALEADVVDEEEYRVMQELREVKLAYRRQFKRLKELREEQEPLIASVAEARRVLIDTFTEWFRVQMENAAKVVEVDPDQERERLELERVMATDPDGLAYFTALKTLKQQRRGGRPLSNSKKMRSPSSRRG